MKIVAYYRCSTKRQAASHLGLDAQQEAVRRYAETNGAEVLAEFEEHESGTRADRPELARAIRRAKACGARLVISRLDRLARNAAFVTGLLASGVDFACCDYPSANRMSLQMLSVFAEEEARVIGVRIKDALAQAKRRGVRLGAARQGWRDDWRRKGQRSLPAARAKHSERVAGHYADVLPRVVEAHESGDSLAVIAAELNGDGFVTSRGLPFTAVAVHRLLARV